MKLKWASHVCRGLLFISLTSTVFYGCGSPDKPEEEEEELDTFVPPELPRDPVSSNNLNDVFNNDQGGSNDSPRTFGENGDETYEGEGKPKDPPTQGPPPDRPPPQGNPIPGGEPIPGQPGQPGQPGEPGEQPGPGAGEAQQTPEQFEGVWTFYNYCVIAEDETEARHYADLFPTEEHFLSWLAEIQKTVAAIRIRLPYSRDARVPQDNCSDAYNFFKTKVTFDLSPNPAKNERFDIVNIDPISGLPGLKGLNLSDNKIVYMKFLRNLEALKFLDLSLNKIESIPSLRRNMFTGLLKLEELGLEYQGDEFTPVDIEGVAKLWNVRSFKMLRLKGNTISPASLRYFPEEFRVSTTRVLKFVVGAESCMLERWGFRYPNQLEEKRQLQCGS